MTVVRENVVADLLDKYALKNEATDLQLIRESSFSKLFYDYVKNVNQLMLGPEATQLFHKKP